MRLITSAVMRLGLLLASSFLHFFTIIMFCLCRDLSIFKIQ